MANIEIFKCIDFNDQGMCRNVLHSSSHIVKSDYKGDGG